MSMSANGSAPAQRGRIDVGTLMALLALAISGLSFYRSYLYTKQDLEVTVTQVSYVTNQGGAYLGIRVATMNSDGNLYLLEHAVVRLSVDREGRIQRAEPAIHRTLRGFEDLQGAPPGDKLQSNKRTPFVWADEHS